MSDRIATQAAVIAAVEAERAALERNLEAAGAALKAMVVKFRDFVPGRDMGEAMGVLYAVGYGAACKDAAVSFGFIADQIDAALNFGYRVPTLEREP